MGEQTMTYMQRALHVPTVYRRLYSWINNLQTMRVYDELNSKTTTNVHDPHITFEDLIKTQVPEL